VSRMAPHSVHDHLRFESARVIKACRVNRNVLGHGDEGQVDRCSAGGAEGMYFLVPAVTDKIPNRSLAGDLNVCTMRKGQIGSVTGAASFLAIAALAMALHDGFAARFITPHAHPPE
jgi:hypothetical protein